MEVRTFIVDLQRFRSESSVLQQTNTLVGPPQKQEQLLVRTRSALPRAFCCDGTETSLISAAEETKTQQDSFSQTAESLLKPRVGKELALSSSRGTGLPIWGVTGRLGDQIRGRCRRSARSSRQAALSRGARSRTEETQGTNGHFSTQQPRSRWEKAWSCLNSRKEQKTRRDFNCNPRKTSGSAHTEQQTPRGYVVLEHLSLSTQGSRG